MSIFLAIMINISDQRVLTAPREADCRFPSVLGVGEAGNRKFGVILVKTGRIQPANVGFFRDLDPDRRTAP